MLTELVKALEEKKATLRREFAELHAKQAQLQGGDMQLAREIGEKERLLALITEGSIKEYKALWQSFTPGSPFPCPSCFVFQKKISPLKPLPREDEVEPLTCTVCNESFRIPIELLYA
jgi:hypothetical protein